MGKIKDLEVVKYLISIFFVIGALYCGYRTIDTEHVKFRIVAIFITILLIMMIGVLFFCTKIWRWKIESIYVIEAAVLGLIMMLIIPVNVAPDEPGHIWTTYNISNKVFGIGMNESNGSIYMRADDFNTSLRTTGIDEEYYEYYYGLFGNRLNNAELVDTAFDTIDTPWYQYIFSATGITIGRVLSLGTITTWYLGRLFNAIFFIFMIYWSIKKIPFGKMLVFVIALLPMTLQQMGSFSYDSFIIPMGIYIISMTLHICYSDGSSVKIWDYILLIFAAMLLLPLKNKAYFAISLVPFLIVLRKRKTIMNAIKKYKEKNKKTFLIISMATAIIVCLLFVLAGIKIVNFVADGGLEPEKIVPWSGTQAYTIGYFLKNPFDILQVMAMSIYNYGTFHYIYGFIGDSLGWFELGIPSFIAVIFILILFVAALNRKNENLVFSKKSKIYMNIMAFIAVCCIFAGMLLGWTPMGLGYVEGVQGRYFTPFALIPLISIRSKRITVVSTIDNDIMLMIPTVFSVVFASLILRA